MSSKNNQLNQMMKENPEQVKRGLSMQLAQISKQLKIESEDLKLSKHEHDKLSATIKGFDQSVRDYMEAGDYVEAKLKLKIQEVQTEFVNFKKGHKPK